MLRIICTAVVACTIILSCSNATKNEIPTIDVEKAVDGQRKGVNLSEWVSDLDYIALETDTVVLPNYIHFDLVPTKSGFVFTPKMGRSPLYNFDASGKFINSFSRVGRAYGEYPAVRMSHYDETSGKFTVVDINGKVWVYTLAGDFLYEIPVESLTEYSKVRDFLQFDGNVFLLTRKKDMLSLDALEINSLGIVKCERELLVYNDVDKFDSAEAYFYYDNGARIIHKSVDTIFSVTSDLDIKPAFALNFGKYKDGKKRKITLGGNVKGETEDFVLLQTTHIVDYFDNIPPKERLNYLLFDKRDGTSTLMAKNENDIHGFVNDIDNGAPFLPVKIVDGKMYQIIDAASFIEFSKKSSSDKMKKVAATLTEESNPVIVVATLK